MNAYTIASHTNESGEYENYAHTCTRCGNYAEHESFEKLVLIVGEHNKTCRIINCDCGVAHNPWVMGCMEAAK